jgi:NAD(P)-dependent dehydrogenase (short-subunit alcohol dehydrogenase family)
VINMTGMFLTCKHAIREMLKVGGGSLIITGSPMGLLGIQADPGETAYGASKAAQIALARSWAAETVKTGPRVIITAPAPMATATRKVAFPGQNPAELAQPAQVAPLLAALCLPAETRHGESIRLAPPRRRAGCAPDDGTLTLFIKAAEGAWFALLEQPAPLAVWRRPSAPKVIPQPPAAAATPAAATPAATAASASAIALADGTLLVRGLEPYVAYRFRIASSGARGASEGEPSAPLLTDAPEPSLVRPPRVRVIRCDLP